MLEWFLKTIERGDQDLLVHIDEVTIGLKRPGVAWLGAIFIAAAVVFIARRQKRNLKTTARPVRVMLTALRVCLLWLWATILAEPYLKLDHQITLRPIIAVAIDHSNSMDFPAQSSAPDTQSRAERANSIAERFCAEMSKQHKDRFDLRIFEFAGDVRKLDLIQNHRLTSSPSETLRKHESNLGNAVEEVLEDSAGRNLTGILLLSDGQDTSGNSLEVTARKAASSHTPVFTIPIGDLEQVRDIAIVVQPLNRDVRLGDIAQVSATVQSHGFDGDVEVTLHDGDEVVARNKVPIILKDDRPQNVELGFEPKVPGSRPLVVKVSERPGEITMLNNQDSTLLCVTKERLKVLFIDEMPRWDYRFLRNAMRRDRGLSGKTAGAPDVFLSAELSNLPDLTDYDTVILGDISAGRIPDGWVEQLAQAIENNGLGLIIAAGPRSMPHEYGPPLLQLLPVKPIAGDILAAPTKAFRIEITPQGHIDGPCRLHDELNDNQAAWNGMPAYFWSANVRRTSKTCLVLAVNPDTTSGPIPLIAWHRFGAGRVLFVGTDSTWLWRDNHADHYFYKFWGQAIRFVASRKVSNGAKSRIDCSPIRVKPGQAVHVQVTTPGAAGGPGQERNRVLQIKSPTRESSLQLAADGRQDGFLTGDFVVEDPGLYHLHFTSPDGSDISNDDVFCSPINSEIRDPMVNRRMLDALARDSGGQMIEEADFRTLTTQVDGTPTSVRLYREQTLWDNWLVLAVICILYSFDLALRRSTGLT